MFIEDSVLRLAHADHPTLLHRLAEFVETRCLQDKPALIIQASPTEKDLEINVLLPATVLALRGNQMEQHSWWNGFRTNYQPTPTFRGVAAYDDRAEPNWAYELHRDGHLIAGVWRFPTMLKGNAEVACLADFYSEIFADFASKALGLLASDGEGISAQLTAVLLNGSNLHFAKMAEFGAGHVISSPIAVRHLCWRIRNVSDAASWNLAAARMGAELLGIGGAKP
jgi:hypothetical protein